jgi:hypothetical protein
MCNYFPLPKQHLHPNNPCLSKPPNSLMNRPPASRFFQKPHEILSSTPFSHSRARNRSSGGSSVSSHQGQPPQNLLIDSSDEDGPLSARSQDSRSSKSRSRSGSPPWDGLLGPGSIPLLPMQEGASSGQGAGRSLLSRTPSPFLGNSDDLDRLGLGNSAGPSGWRIGEGSAGGERYLLGQWTRNGKLGWWLWNTQRGWMVYIGFLVVLYGGAGFGLSKVNGFTLLSEYFQVTPFVTESISEVRFCGRVLTKFL